MLEAVGKAEQNSRINNDLSTFDLKNILAEIKAHEAWQKGEHSAKTLIKDHRQRITLVALRGGTKIASHQANGPISVQMIDGKMKFTTPMRSVTLENGQILTLRSKIQHSMEALQDSAFLLTMVLEGDEIQHPAVTGEGAQPVEAQKRTAVQMIEAGGERNKGTKSIQRVIREERRLLPLNGKPIGSLEEYETGGGLRGLRRAVDLSPDQIIDEIIASAGQRIKNFVNGIVLTILF